MVDFKKKLSELRESKGDLTTAPNKAQITYLRNSAEKMLLDESNADTHEYFQGMIDALWWVESGTRPRWFDQSVNEHATVKMSQCRRCGSRGPELDEFTSPYSGLCADCSNKMDDAITATTNNSQPPTVPTAKSYVSVADLEKTVAAAEKRHAEVALLSNPNFRVEALMGPAGSGKTYMIRERMKADPLYAVLAATTGVAAVNLGQATTINSLLGYYDLEGLLRSAREGYITRKFKQLIRRGVQFVAIDEISMMPAAALDAIYESAKHAADELYEAQLEGRSLNFKPTGIIVTGDFLQLPPITKDRDEPIPYAFKAKCWPEFEKNLTVLNTHHRQSNPEFLKALAGLRSGGSVPCVLNLKKCGVKFTPDVDEDFKGITLFATNPQVEKYNRDRLAKEDGEELTYTTQRWGNPARDWDVIPDTLKLRVGCQIMIRVNSGPDLMYVNGSLATVLPNVEEKIEDFTSGRYPCTTETTESESELALAVEVAHNGNKVALRKIVRQHLDYTVDGTPEQWTGPKYDPDNDDFWEPYFRYLERYQMKGEPYWEPKMQAQVIGEIDYMPVSLGYAMTVHKSQGLTLEAVQIDSRPNPAGQPALMYVALSRCKEPENITVVGSLNTLLRHMNTSPEVKVWI